MKYGNRGFSLLDVLLVGALATVLLGLAVPSIQGSMQGYRLTAAADQLAAELNAARVLAVSRGTQYRVNFMVNDARFQIVDVSDPDNPTRVVRDLGNGVTFAAVPSTPIIFTSRGTARGGAVMLDNGSGHRMVVQVDASGKTTVQDMEAVAHGY